MNVRRNRQLLRGARWLLAAAWVSCSLVLASAHAQDLPPAAADALGQAQRSAATALIEYTRHTPDRPLWVEALRFGRAAADAAPEHPAPQRFLAQAYEQVGFYARAWESWVAYRAFGGTLDAVAERHVIEVARWMGVATYDSGRQAEAIPYFQTLLELVPFDPIANERLARTYLEQGEPLRARPYLEAVEGTIPDLEDDLVYVRRLDRYGEIATQAFADGLAAAAEGDASTALARYRDATRAAPGFVEAWRAVAEAALAIGRDALAAEAVDRLLTLAPGDPTGLAARNALAQDAAARLTAEAEQAAAQEAAAEAAARAAAQAEAARTAEAERVEAERAEAERVEAERAAAAQAEAEAERATVAESDEAEAAAEAAARAEAQAQAEAATAQAAAEAEALAVAEREAEAARLEAEAEARREAEAEAAVAAVPAEGAFLTLGDARHVHGAAGGANAAIAYVAAPALETDLSAHVGDVLQVRVTVVERTGDAPMWFQFCLVPPDVAVAPACSAEDLLTLGAAGTYDVSLPWRTLDGAGAVAWQRGVDALMWVLRRPDGTPVAGSSADADRYLPTTLRVQAIAVPTGR